MKKLIIEFKLADINVFWIYLSKITKHLNFSYLRSYLYKMSLNNSLHDNIFLKSKLAICYIRTGNYDLSIKYIKDIINLKEQTKNDPFLYLQICFNYLFKSLSRNNHKKNYSLLEANNNLNKYTQLRIKDFNQEVLYNQGRFYQFIGHDKLAFEKYNQLLKIDLETKNESKYSDNNINIKVDKDNENIRMSCIYNYALLLKKSGNEHYAHEMLMQNIII